jgi:hypothetical protein
LCGDATQPLRVKFLGDDEPVSPVFLDLLPLRANQVTHLRHISGIARERQAP